MSEWLVSYRVTYRGITVVEAEDAKAALAQVNSGVFEDDAGAERVEWKAYGTPSENV
jgi:hypothetical protein